MFTQALLAFSNIDIDETNRIKIVCQAMNQLYPKQKKIRRENTRHNTQHV